MSRLSLGVLASIIGAGASDAYHTEVMADSPLIYLPFDEGAAPPINYGDSGSAVISAYTSYPTFGGAGVGDGATAATFAAAATEGVALGGKADTGTDFVIEGLIRVSSLAAARCIASITDSGGNTQYFGVHTDGKLRVTTAAPSWATVLYGSAALSVGTRYHVAMLQKSGTSGANNVEVYVNGSLDAGLTCAFSNTGVTNWYIGRRSGAGFENPFSGQLGGFAVHSPAISAARILAHAQAAGVA